MPPDLHETRLGHQIFLNTLAHETLEYTTTRACSRILSHSHIRTNTGQQNLDYFPVRGRPM